MPILAWGMAPALPAGNTVVAKPAEMTPLTAIRIGELAAEAGLPDGVFQVLPGQGSVVGQRLVDHPAVRKIVFTGSTEVGRQIMAGCARQVKRLTLELGGKSANIEEVFGPVVTVTPFEDEADAVSIANETPYGLSGSIWTRDVGRAIRVARAVESGNLSVNSHSSVRYWTPFGGFKQSGLGRELGPDAPDAFTEIKNVFIATE